jgi:chromosome segregation ATPase
MNISADSFVTIGATVIIGGVGYLLKSAIDSFKTEVKQLRGDLNSLGLGVNDLVAKTSIASTIIETIKAEVWRLRDASHSHANSLQILQTKDVALEKRLDKIEDSLSDHLTEE